MRKSIRRSKIINHKAVEKLRKDAEATKKLTKSEPDASELKKYESIIKPILECNRPARNSDKILYLLVLNKMGIKADCTLEEWCLSASYPSFESIGRCRRKIQSNNPSLMSDYQIKFFKKKRESEFKEYAKS